MTNPSDELTRCREEIAAIDRQLVTLLKKRVDLGKQTGVIKREMGLPILDPSREAAVIRGAVEAARELDLPDEQVREIFWRILGLSRSAQEMEAK